VRQGVPRPGEVVASFVRPGEGAALRGQERVQQGVARSGKGEKGFGKGGRGHGGSS